MQDKLDLFLLLAVEAYIKLQSAHLGDRSSFDANGIFTGYIGASDIAGCPRKAVMSRRQPQPFTFTTLLRFIWGHAAQALFRKIFIAGKLDLGKDFTEEVELVHPTNPRIKCHIDFLFESPYRLHVVEKKATKTLPDEAYQSWLNQLQVQTGMLKRDSRSKGLPIGGSVFATEPLPRESEQTGHSGYRRYGSYEPNDQEYEKLMKKAEHILDALDGKCEPKCEPGPLCGTCAHNIDCPSRKTISVNIPDQVLDAARRYEELLAEQKRITAELQSLKQSVLDYTGQNFSGQCDGTDVVANHVEGREFIDTTILRTNYPEAYKGSVKKTRGWTTLTVRPVTQATAEADDQPLLLAAMG